MKTSQIAAQLYTLREHCKTIDDLGKTLEKVRKIGYQAVQVSGIGADIKPEDAARLCKDNGLVICATHDAPPLIRKEPLRVVETLKTYGCKYTAYPFPREVDFSKKEDLDSLIEDLERSGAVMAEFGCELHYHNHAIEFAHVDGKPVLEVIREKTTPAHLAFELDTYWVQCGGGDPVEWCERVSGRIKLLHVKDYVWGFDAKPHFAEIGSGNLNWPRIIAAAEKAGCEWFIVEQDICPGDPFESLKKSFDFLSGLAKD